MPDANQAQSDAWHVLDTHRDEIKSVHLRQIFAEDPQRFDSFSMELPGLLLDYSRQRVTHETLKLLIQLAEKHDLADWIKRLFAGDEVNCTEHRPALHTLLRQPAGEPLDASLGQYFGEITAVRKKIDTFAHAVRDGDWLGGGGERITDIVNIGIGGSHLGAQMAIKALTPLADAHPRIHFMANIDPVHAANLLNRLDPETTLFIVVSKTFTTKETLTNAETARQWWQDATGGQDGFDQHFVAVTANPEEAVRFGVAEKNVFPFWDWVGGRYSVWSAVGLSVAICLGPDIFRELHEGAHQMDRHFAEAPFAANMPVLLGLIDIWNTDLLGFSSRVVVPYRDCLVYLPVYLQQLEMESNGKRVRRDGTPVSRPTQPVIWGNVGTNGQHAFFQLLHQGTQIVPVDFIIPFDDDTDNQRQRDMLVANCLAQAEAFARGRTEAETREVLAERGGDKRLLAHQTFPGNRPSSLLVMDRLDARTLGMLIALYEHKVFVTSCIWGVNPFDQMGVELGKALAGHILGGLEGTKTVADPATAALVERYRHITGR